MEIKNSTSSSRYNCQFFANIKSPQLKFKQDDFFVRIRGYGKNTDWANKTKETADTAVNLARNNTSAENVLRFITAGIIKANNLCKSTTKATHTGILRTDRANWKTESDWKGLDLVTNYSKTSRYKHYQTRLNYVLEHPLDNPFSGIELTKPVIKEKESFLKHASCSKVNNALKLIFEKYTEFFSKFNSKDINNSQLEEVNSRIAEIRWIMAHSTPWERGSDAISNVLIRVMYKAIGIKSYPLKKGISLDLEAYCTNLDEYKKNFTNYFDQKPKIIE